MPRFTSARAAAAAMVLVWLVPAVLLVRGNSRWTPVAAAGLFVALSAVWRGRQPREGSASHVETWPISPPMDTPPMAPLVKLAAAGAMIQLAALAEGTGRPVAAGLFTAGAVALILYRLPVDSRERWATRHRRASVALALALALIGLIRWSVLRFAPAFDYPRSAEASSREETTPPDLSFRGVILFVKPPPERVLPPLLVPDAAGKTDPSHEPLVIPFSGVYWFMKAPSRVPPPSSLVQFGSPDELFYRSATREALTMEAHQHLGRHISFRCCAALEADVVTVDRYPGTVLVEVIVDDTASPGYRRTLGAQAVRETGHSLFGQAKPMRETLRFPFPAAAGWGAFDEITVRFHLAGMRNTRSARVAIERFVLRPRGR